MMRKMRLFLTFCLAVLLALPSFCLAGSGPVENGYTLEQVLMVSRHGIRAPYKDGMLLYKHTPHRWYQWTARRGELTPRGGLVEAALGQYFRSYYVAVNFMPANWEPEAGEVRIFANSYQRTIASAQYFSTGLLPVANVTVERRFALNKKDPVFNPGFPVSDAEYRAALLDEWEEQGHGRGLAGWGDGLQPNVDLLNKVLDTENSLAVKEEGFRGFDLADTTVEFTENNYKVHSSLGLAADLTDALLMQYYEDSTDNASFGNGLTAADWRTLGRIYDRYLSVITASPSYADARNRNLLRMMLDELQTEGRRFSFLCGHDTNLMCLKTNLRLADCELQDTPLASPISAKLVLEKWLDEDGNAFMEIRLVYPGASQIRGGQSFTLQNPPRSCLLQLEGLERHGPYGFYAYEDVLQRLQEAADRAAETNYQ